MTLFLLWFNAYLLQQRRISIVRNNLPHVYALLAVLLAYRSSITKSGYIEAYIKKNHAVIEPA